MSSQWPGGFNANVIVTNLGGPVNGWTLTWTYAAGQQVSQYRNASITQSGGQVRAANASYNTSIGSNASVSFGFNGSWSGNNPAPASFALNGTTCTGDTTTPPTGSLPGSFRWNSSGALIGPKNDGRGAWSTPAPAGVLLRPAAAVVPGLPDRQRVLLHLLNPATVIPRARQAGHRLPPGSGCTASLTVQSWPGGFVTIVHATAGATAINGWNVRITLSAGAVITGTGSSGTPSCTAG